MDDKRMRHIMNDRNLESYRGFMDYDWAKAVSTKSVGTPFEFAIFDLTMSWKGSSNTFAMPLLMVEGSRAFWTAFSQSHCDQTMVLAVIKEISERLCREVEFSNMKRKEVKAAVDRIVREAAHAEEVTRSSFVFPTEQLWYSYLTPKQPGSAEFHLILWTSQRLCFSSLIHAYEFFVQDVLRIKGGKSDSWRPRFSDLISEMSRLLGDSIADECLTHADIDAAKRIRNSLAHNGGRETDDLKGKHKIRTCPDGRLHIWPEDNRQLFELLKDRASKIIDAALK
jgi:hypothetical protein